MAADAMTVYSLVLPYPAHDQQLPTPRCQLVFCGQSLSPFHAARHPLSLGPPQIQYSPAATDYSGHLRPFVQIPHTPELQLFYHSLEICSFSNGIHSCSQMFHLINDLLFLNYFAGDFVYLHVGPLCCLAAYSLESLNSALWE